MSRRDPITRRGFTLIEILMVVVILGIASAVIVPQIGTRNDLKVSAAARIVMADLIYAQNRSIASQQMFCVAYDDDAESYELVAASNRDTPITNPISKDPYAVALSATGGLEDVTIESVNFNGQSMIGFDELGTPYGLANDGTATELASAGTIVLRSGEFTLTISIEPFTGEITLP